jgi:hypothetical protein
LTSTPSVTTPRWSCSLRLLMGAVCIELLIRHSWPCYPGRPPRPLLAKGNDLVPMRRQNRAGCTFTGSGVSKMGPARTRALDG